MRSVASPTSAAPVISPVAASPARPAAKAAASIERAIAALTTLLPAWPGIGLDDMSDDIAVNVLWKFLSEADVLNVGLVSRLWLRRILAARSQLAMIHPETGAVNRLAFRYLGCKVAIGTEGRCFKVAYLRDGRVYAMRRAKPSPMVEGVPYYLLRELEVLRDLKHANVCACAAVSLANAKLTVFYRYGTFSLSQAINPQVNQEGGNPLPLTTVRRVLYQVLRALACCHGRGVIHRNVKPKHIIFMNAANEPCSAAREADVRCGCGASPMHT